MQFQFPFSSFQFPVSILQFLSSSFHSPVSRGGVVELGVVIQRPDNSARSMDAIAREVKARLVLTSL